MKAKHKQRIHGLDTLRAAAIILVFLTHYGFVVHHAVFDIGWIGVDLFFALSGYLIGNQIFKALANKHNFSFVIFMLRRLIRTLPNYWAVLALYFLIPGFREKPILLPLWKFLTFTVNLGLVTGVAFSHAWSLCVEEQFYLALPILAIIIYKLKSRKIPWILIAVTIIGGMVLRGYLWIHYIGELHLSNPDLFNYKSYYSDIYYFTLCRLDPIVCGVIIAIIRNFYAKFWHKITMNFGNTLLGLGIASLLATCYMFMRKDYAYADGITCTIIGFPLLGISFGLLVISALSPNSLLHKTRIWGAEKLALWSYAIYLLQKPLDNLAANFLESHGIISRNSISMFICTATFSIFGGWLLYFIIETPFLKIRDKLL
jgi:peptidoglycan/LPS O-acetylase OafA/YrhL